MESDENAAISAIMKWRARLSLDMGASRAASARLRRCSNIFDALLERETIELIKSVKAAGGARSVDANERLAVIAIALAHSPKNGALRFTAALGRTSEGKAPSGDERPRFSPARFTGLMRAARAREWDNLARALRRAFAILGDAPFNVTAFVEDLVFLNDRRLRRWTYDYWQTSSPEELTAENNAPSSNETETLP